MPAKQFETDMQNELLRRDLEKYRDQAELLTNITENMLDMVCVIDLKGKFMFAVKSREIFGYEPGFLIGKNFTDFVHPEDLPHVLKAYEKIVGFGKASRIEFRCRCNDGTYLWIETRGSFLNDKKRNWQGIVLTSRDISERKQAEEDLLKTKQRFDFALQATNTGLWDWNVQTGEVIFTEQWAAMVGYTIDELRPLGIQTWMDLCHPDDLSHSNALLEKHFKKESENYQCEARMKHKNGAWIWILDRGRVIEWDEYGNPLRMIGTHTDITEHKRVEAEKLELETQNWQLQKTESLGRMAGAIAHHFNNQLQVVMGNLEIAIDDLPRGSHRLGSLVEAMSASHKAMEISGLMLTYLGQTHGRHEPVDLSGICRKSLALLQASAPRNARLKGDFPYPGPVIHANANQIQQILTNLVSNAWEAFDGRDGTVNLTISTVSHADISAGMKHPIDWQLQNIAYACLEVIDKGRGIAERDIEKIFDPFFTTKFTGRGLGLPVAVGIVKAHGGGVTVESEPGMGSTFRVFLPVSEEENFWLDAMPEKTPVTHVRSELNSGPGRGGTVLVVEDDEQVRKLTCSMLTHLGYTAIEANDGLAAVGVFKQHHRDIGCVLSDLTMPHMDGWDTLTALREISPGIPVILSSGYDEAQIMAAGHPQRPDAFLSKPYQCKDLGDAIAGVLTKK